MCSLGGRDDEGDVTPGPNSRHRRAPPARVLQGGDHHATTARPPAARPPDRDPLSRSRIEKLDKRFPKQGNAGIDRIATGFRWAEGPVYSRDGGYFVWSDIPNNRMMRWLEEDGM